MEGIMEQTMRINETEYHIRKLLGKGKGGYSYLADNGTKEYVLKQIHHEPCDYYQFGNKIEAELRDYERLKKIGIRMPKLIDVDREQERIRDKKAVCATTVSPTDAFAEEQKACETPSALPYFIRYAPFAYFSTEAEKGAVSAGKHSRPASPFADCFQRSA